MLSWVVPQGRFGAGGASSGLWRDAGFAGCNVGCNFLQGLLLWTSGVADNALYPVLILDYLTYVFPIFKMPACRQAATCFIILALTWVNYRGLHAVGMTAVWLAIFGLTPFIAIIFLGVPRLQPSLWNWQVHGPVRPRCICELLCTQRAHVSVCVCGGWVPRGQGCAHAGGRWWGLSIHEAWTKVLC